MKGKYISTVPLFFCLILLLVTCYDASKVFSKGNYSRALEILDYNKSLDASDYYVRFRSEEELGYYDEAKDSAAIYLLLGGTSIEESLREEAVNTFIKYNNSPELAILVLKPTDGNNAVLSLYKSYASLNEAEKCKDILEKYALNFLDFPSYLQLLLDYPFDVEYTIKAFSGWYSVITVEEKN
ncbi:MAG: hypothetical protein HUK23_05505, partial [Sphaerochaetaceae bacterium]|nr:hypothetical protein [Sphaerochaetaceae bacterium]